MLIILLFNCFKASPKVLRKNAHNVQCAWLMVKSKSNRVVPAYKVSFHCHSLELSSTFPRLSSTVVSQDTFRELTDG